ncbi:hypothetical protein GFH48_12330 [Streptomyces fagopyri]|uniref:Lipoprotein n=1 Tax=Streptomyces fagopyri TaxID=2662397 RepID=A0A5Q0LAG5_9ACTN|nr:hypothetical protein [Streptomyces fagopyri]QFZ73928.1 hypothetical protein GFH48_12330 [Streptomyces fagopyri]
MSSFTPPSRTPSGPRRRSLLTSAAGAAVLVGCSAPESSSPAGTAGRSPSAADAARARAARESETLAARYADVIAAHPPLAKLLDPLRTEVVRHAQAFGATGSRPGDSPSASPSASPAASSAGSPSASSASSASASPSASLSAASSAPASATVSPAVPVRAKDALAGLATVELALVDRRTTALLDVPGELARLLASVAAAGAAHAFLLTEEAK